MLALHHLELFGAAFSDFAHMWTGFHRKGAPRSLWCGSRRHSDSGTHSYISER